MNASCIVKAPSSSQLEEINEGKTCMKIFFGIVGLLLGCGLIATLSGLKLIKIMMGVESFGFPTSIWLGIHFLIFLFGIVLCIAAVIAFAVLCMLFLRWCRAI